MSNLVAIKVKNAQLYYIADHEGSPDLHIAECYSQERALLIAAAPDLLAACEEAFKYTPFHGIDCEGVDRAGVESGDLFEDVDGCTCFVGKLRTAIAKARGETS